MYAGVSAPRRYPTSTLGTSPSVNSSSNWKILSHSPRPPRGRPAHYGGTHPNGLPTTVHIKTQDMLKPQERKLLEAAEAGDKPTMLHVLNNVSLMIKKKIKLYIFKNFFIYRVQMILI